eukprot:scaffold131447_cov46-Prasinocladus_malaysianus.AAC.1
MLCTFCIIPIALRCAADLCYLIKQSIEFGTVSSNDIVHKLMQQRPKRVFIRKEAVLAVGPPDPNFDH